MNTPTSLHMPTVASLLRAVACALVLAINICLLLGAYTAPAFADEYQSIQTLNYGDLTADSGYHDTYLEDEGDLSATSTMFSSSASSSARLAAAFVAATFDACETKVVLPNASKLGIDKKAFAKGYQMAMDDPRFFYVDQTIRYGFSADGKKLTLWPKYLWSSKAKIKAQKKRFYDAAAEALTWVSPSMSDVEKAQALHDYLVRTCIYDREAALYSGTGGIWGSDKWVAHTAYGALVNKSTVCQGYSAAYKLLCSQVGLECLYVVSEENNHGWNLVKVKGKWYHVDITFDDPSNDYYFTESTYRDGGFNGAVSHTYFLLGDMSMHDDMHYPWTRTQRASEDHPDYDYPIYNAPVSNLHTIPLETGISVSYAGNITYSGSAVKPAVSLAKKYADGSSKPIKSSSFSVRYLNNVKPGKALAIITFKDAAASEHSLNPMIAKFTVKKIPVKRSSVTLKATSYTYDGKAKRPGVKSVKVNGKAIPADEYSVSYSSNKKVGTATVKVSLKYYDGPVTKTFKIKPKAVRSTSLSAGKGTLKVRWKTAPKSGAVTGYQIRYSVKSNMKNSKQLDASKKSASKTIKPLKPSKRYYVQVRSYTVVKGKTYCSSWSKKQSARVW